MTDIVLNCCVVDDEPLARQLICSFIEKTPFLQLKGSFSSASEAVKCIVSGQMNLVFLDIQMPELDGLEFAKIIPPECRIIFVTAFEKYAIEGFRNNAIDYLLKPVSYNEFLSAANRALQWEKLKAKAETASPDENRFIIVKSEYKLIQIDTRKILYIEGLKDYVKIYTEDSPNCILSGLPGKSPGQVHGALLAAAHHRFGKNARRQHAARTIASDHFHHDNPLRRRRHRELRALPMPDKPNYLLACA